MKSLLIFWTLGVIALVILFSTLGHCTVQPRPNSLGVFQTYESPYTYMVGAPVRVAVFEEKGNYYTNVEFKALGASMLNTVNILFCGNAEDVFRDGRLHVVTYRIHATRLYRFVGCHDIMPGDLGVFVMEDSQ